MAVLAAAPALVHQHNNAEPDKRQSVGDRADRRRSSSRAAHRSLKRGRRFEPRSLYRTPVGTFEAYMDEESVLINRHKPPLNRHSNR